MCYQVKCCSASRTQKPQEIKRFLRFRTDCENGGEGSRTPVLDTVDASISMFRRGLLLSPVIRSASAFHLSQEPVDVIPGAVPPPNTCLLKLVTVLPSRRQESGLGANLKQPLRILYWNRHLIV